MSIKKQNRQILNPESDEKIFNEDEKKFVSFDIFAHFLRENKTHTQKMCKIEFIIQDQTLQEMELSIVKNLFQNMQNIHTFKEHITDLKFLGLEDKQTRLDSIVKNQNLAQITVHLIMGLNSPLDRLKSANLQFSTPHGSIIWHNKTSCMDFLFNDPDLIKIQEEYVEVYNKDFLERNGIKKPEEGSYLNTKAYVTFNSNQIYKYLNQKQLEISFSSRNSIKQIIQSRCEFLQIQLIDFDQNTGQFTVLVDNFNKTIDFHFKDLENYYSKLFSQGTQNQNVKISSTPFQSETKQKINKINPQTNKKEFTLVLDLDQTLIHTTESFKVLVRPHLQKFLKEVSQHYEIFVFTASLQDYADFVISQIDPLGIITKRFYRQDCIIQDGQYVKDLKILNKDLSKVILLDNSEIHLKLNPFNVMLIKDWLGQDIIDEELIKTSQILQSIAQKNLNIQETLYQLIRNYFSQNIQNITYTKEFSSFIQFFYKVNIRQPRSISTNDNILLRRRDSMVQN